MSVLNVLLRDARLLVAVDTLAHQASSGHETEGAKVFVVPSRTLVFAGRGSAQLLLLVYQLVLQASYTVGFTMERVMSDLGPTLDKLWPQYVAVAEQSNIPHADLSIEIVFGGWSTAQARMAASAYIKTRSDVPAEHHALVGGLASPGAPLRTWKESFAPDEILRAGVLQAQYLNAAAGKAVAGGRLLCCRLTQHSIRIDDLGPISTNAR